MAQDWLADVRKYDANADENVVAGIVRHCGIALRSRDASLVSMTDPKETGRVRDSFLKKKLARTESDTVLDAAIANVGETMKAANFKNRVTVYYLLAKHFGQLELFNKPKKAHAKKAGAAKAPAKKAAAKKAPAKAAPAKASSAKASTTAAAAATGAAAAGAAGAGASSAATSTGDTPVMSAMSGTAAGGGSSGGPGAGSPPDPSAIHHPPDNDDDGLFALGCVVALVAFGAILFAAILTVWANSTILAKDPEAAAAAAAAPPPPPPPPAAELVEAPEGSGVVASNRDGRPMLSTYFDSGSSEVTPDFESTAADVLAYLEANPDASVQISGFNDPTGNAELNAALSKSRAENVQAALVAAGVPSERTELVKPDDTTTEELSNAEARRVEVTIVG